MEKINSHNKVSDYVDGWYVKNGRLIIGREPGMTGILINGVEILNYKSNDILRYGKIDEIEVVDVGDGYDIINPPVLNVSDVVGSGATGYAAITGSLSGIRVINEGFDYLGKDKTWYLHIDADILLKDDFMSTFPTHPKENRPYIKGYVKKKDGEEEYNTYLDGYFYANALYTMGRVNVDIDEDFKQFNPQEYFKLKGSMKQRFNGYGYFQLFHLPS